MRNEIRESVSLLRKYSYEFGAFGDMQTYEMMLNAQKEIVDQSDEKDVRIAQLEDALKSADEHYKFVELGYVGLIDLKRKLLNALKGEKK
jgi:hypothetical protein